MVLRERRNHWAERICGRRAFRLFREETRHEVTDPGERARRLKAAGIEAFEHTSKGVLSKYFLRSGSGGRLSHDAIYVVEDSGRTTPVEEFTPLYKRYADTVRVWRLYVDGAQSEAAHRVLGAMP